MNRLIIIALSVLIILMLYKGCEQRDKINDLTTRIGSDANGYEELIKRERNKLNQELVSIQLSEQTTREELLSERAAHGSTREELQRQVRKNTRLAAVVRSETSQVVVGPTDTVYVREIDSMPVYQTSFSDKWADITVMVSTDTIIVDYLIRNEFVFKAERERTGLFKSDLRASVLSMNPNTSTVGLSTWTVPKQKPKRLAWLGVGVAIGLLIGVR